MFQHLLQRASSIPTHQRSETRHQRDTQRFEDRVSDEQTSSGRRGQRQDDSSADGDASCYRQRISGSADGSYRNISHPAL